MRKRVTASVIALLLICMMCVQVAQAAGARVTGAVLELTFEGENAVCVASCKGDSAGDKVEVTLTLYRADKAVASWSGSGTYSTIVSGTHKVTSGETYRLQVEYSINGVEKPIKAITKMCP